MAVKFHNEHSTTAESVAHYIDRETVFKKRIAALEAELQAYRDIRDKYKGVFGKSEVAGVVWRWNYREWEDLDIPQQEPGQ